MQVNQNQRIGIAPVILAICIPPAGFVVGLFTCATNANNGVKLILLSLASGIGWACLFLTWIGRAAGA